MVTAITVSNFRGPDFFVVLDTERRPRPSWVVWEWVPASEEAAKQAQQAQQQADRLARKLRELGINPDTL